MSCVVDGMGGEGPVSGTPEPSSSLLLKQLSMMRRFSPSKRSARLMPGLADMVASPSVRNLGRALGSVGGVSGCFGRRRTAGGWPMVDIRGGPGREMHRMMSQVQG